MGFILFIVLCLDVIVCMVVIVAWVNSILKQPVLRHLRYKFADSTCGATFNFAKSCKMDVYEFRIL